MRMAPDGRIVTNPERSVEQIGTWSQASALSIERRQGNVMEAMTWSGSESLYHSQSQIERAEAKKRRWRTSAISHDESFFFIQHDWLQSVETRCRVCNPSDEVTEVEMEEVFHLLVSNRTTPESKTLI
jgi:hypothetical protein